MILNRNNETISVETNKSNMQKEIEENSKRHLHMYDQIIGKADLEGGIAI